MQEFKVGDKVNALFSNGEERVGNIVEIEQHLVTIRIASGETWTTPACMVRHVK